MSTDSGHAIWMQERLDIAARDRQRLIHRLCLLQRAIAEGAIGFGQPNDCFCLQDGEDEPVRALDYHWRSSGTAVAYIEQAVAEKLERDKRGVDVEHDAFVGAVLKHFARVFEDEGITPEQVAEAMQR